MHGILGNWHATLKNSPILLENSLIYYSDSFANLPGVVEWWIKAHMLVVLNHYNHMSPTHPLSLKRLEIYHSDAFARKLVTKDLLHGIEWKWMFALKL